MSKKDPAPTKYIQANFTECDGVDLLSVFLRQGQRLFPNFSSNEKRTIYDGDLDYLNTNKEIIKIFRCQIKSLKNVSRKFKIEYKYLLACSNKVSFDPLFFFLVDVGDSKKPRFYYLNLTVFKPDKVAECVKNKKSLEISIKEFTELLSSNDLVRDIEKNYLYTLSLSELTLEELRVLMSGITYLNNAINKVPLIRSFLFPDFYSFVAEYAKDTDEGIRIGLFSNKHDVLSIMPTYVDSSVDLIKKYNPEIIRGKFTSRSFNKTAIDEETFREYLSNIFKEAFYYSEHLLPIMPDVVLHELIYAAFAYEWLKIRNQNAKEFYEADFIQLNDVSRFEFDETNPYKRHFKFALNELNKKDIRMVKKVWHYWAEDIRFGIDKIYDKETKLFFKDYPKYANYTLKRLFGNYVNINSSYYYSFKQVGNSRILSLSMLSKSPYDHQSAYELKNRENSEIINCAAFENMNSYAPFFNTIINKCYKVICDKFDCKFDGASVDGTKICVL